MPLISYNRATTGFIKGKIALLSALLSILFTILSSHSDLAVG